MIDGRGRTLVVLAAVVVLAVAVASCSGRDRDAAPGKRDRSGDCLRPSVLRTRRLQPLRGNQRRQSARDGRV